MPADGHYVYAQAWKYQNHYHCSRVRSERSHGHYNWGYSKTDSDSWTWAPTPWGSQDCKAWDRVPPGYLAARFAIYKYVNGGWALCAYVPDFIYNAKTDAKLEIAHSYLQSDLCGSGTYNTASWGYLWIDDDGSSGRWRGGGLWSGAHSLPT